MDGRRLYLAVGACAVVVYLGALWNRFALDDLYIVVLNPLVHSPSGIWRVFVEPYWPGNLTGSLYRPLTVATYAIDWLVDGSAWFHAVNILWHAGVSVAVAALARRWAGATAALAAGFLFAVHPVHVEAVANVVGRNDLMAGAFTLLAVYSALERHSVGWSTAAMALGILSKESAAVVPGLVVWAWLLGLSAPSPRKRAAFIASWLLVGAAYAALRWAVLREYAGFVTKAPVFLGESALTVRLTAVSALGDVARLLVFPLILRMDYSPEERTAVRSVFDGRFVGGMLCLAAWAALIVLMWRRGRKIEAFGLGWIGIAYLPVANLLFPIGILIAERTLYLPSVGLAVAAGAWLQSAPPRVARLLIGLILVAGGARTALRVPAWRDNATATLSLLDDSPRSYRALEFTAWQFLWAHQAERALQAFGMALDKYDRDARVYIAAADAAFTLGRPRVADSLLERANQVCDRCVMAYRNQAGAARLRGDSATADSLLAHARRLRAP